MKKTIFTNLLLLFIFTNCIIVKEMIPKKPTPSFFPSELNEIPEKDLIDDKEIVIDYFFIKGYSEPHTPPNVKATNKLSSFLMETCGEVDLNRSGIIKFSSINNKKSDRIIIFVPGIYSGGATVANLAKSIVKRVPSTECWVWERRSNQLEDRRIFLKALKEKNTQYLLDLLEKNSFKLKKNSFYQPSTEDISFVGYWGLNVQLYDLFYIIKEARKRSKEIILAGYSLGVYYVTIFCAMEFQEQTNIEYGYKLVEKVILYDGPPVAENYIKDENTYRVKGETIFPNNVIDGADKLESGKYYPCNGSGNKDMSDFFLLDLKGILAYLEPQKLSPEKYKFLLNEYNITNLAKYCIEYDDNYQSFKLFTGTFGRSNGIEFGNYNYNDQLFIISPSKNNIIDWVHPQYENKIEFNNIFTYLEIACNEKFNMAEWYQPTRMLLDFGSIKNNDTSTGWQSKYFRITQTKNINNKFLCIGLSRGLSSDISIYLNYKKMINSKDFTIIMINSLTHIDGDTITDSEHTRQYLGDVTANWLLNKNLLKENIKNNGGYYSEINN